MVYAIISYTLHNNIILYNLIQSSYRMYDNAHKHCSLHITEQIYYNSNLKGICSYSMPLMIPHSYRKIIQYCFVLYYRFCQSDLWMGMYDYHSGKSQYISTLQQFREQLPSSRTDMTYA